MPARNVTMPQLSPQTLIMAVQAVEAEMARLKESVDGDITALEPDIQDLMLSYSRAAMDLKAAYLEARRSTPGLPAYNELVSGE